MGTPTPGATESEYLGRSTKRILILSFSFLLALLVVAGVAAIATLANIHTQEQAARLNFLSRTEPLIQIRSKLTIYGDNQQKPVSPEEARQLLAQIRSKLAEYPQERAPAEQQMLDHLTLTLADEDHVHPQALALETEQITFWNDSRFRAVNAGLLASFTHLQNRLKALLFCLLGSGLAIALGSIVFIAAQEKEIRKRYAELARSHTARAQLSARILDVQEEERRSISRELHDEVGQSLGALLVDIGRLSTILPAAEVLKMRQLAESSVSAVRNIALLLRPSMLDDLGLVAAIEWQAREISRSSEIEVEVQAQDLAPNLSEALKICIYRITQETLNNAVRHSGAHRAWVGIQSRNGAIEVRIRDDGKGFDPQRSRGMGILGMEERVRLLRGTLTVNSTVGVGTEITALMPAT